MDGALALVSYVRFWGYSVEKPPLRPEEVIKYTYFWQQLCGERLLSQPK